MNDLLLALPHRITPMLNETVDSYLRRLAAANRQHHWDLRCYIAASNADSAPIPPRRLAAISGVPLPILRQAMLELCTDDDLRTMNVTGRPRPGHRARPGCLRCTKGRTAKFWVRQEDTLICLRHRCLTGPEIWDLTEVPDILQANRRHRRLIRRFGRRAVWKAFHGASAIVTEWENSGRDFIGDSRDRLLTFWRDKDKRVPIDHPTSQAANYPEIIELTRLLVTPHWRTLLLDGHQFQPDVRALMLGGYDHDLYARDGPYLLARRGPDIDEFVAELRRSVDRHRGWFPDPYYRKLDPLASWALDQLKERYDEEPLMRQLLDRQPLAFEVYD